MGANLKHPERLRWYRARVERDHLARFGTIPEFMAARARVDALAPAEFTQDQVRRLLSPEAT